MAVTLAEVAAEMDAQAAQHEAIARRNPAYWPRKLTRQSLLACAAVVERASERLEDAAERLRVWAYRAGPHVAPTSLTKGILDQMLIKERPTTYRLPGYTVDLPGRRIVVHGRTLE